MAKAYKNNLLTCGMWYTNGKKLAAKTPITMIPSCKVFLNTAFDKINFKFMDPFKQQCLNKYMKYAGAIYTQICFIFNKKVNQKADHLYLP